MFYIPSQAVIHCCLSQDSRTRMLSCCTRLGNDSTEKDCAPRLAPDGEHYIPGDIEEPGCYSRLYLKILIAFEVWFCGEDWPLD